MAKQTGPIIWVKTFDFISFYKRCGVGCVRMKSNLTGERWRTDPVFEGSRKSAARMALSAKLASTFYKIIPQHQRSYPYYKQLVGIAQHMLCAGYNILQVNKGLHFAVSRYIRKLQAADPDRKPLRSPFAAVLSLNAKPAFTSVSRYQMAAPVFTAPAVGKSTNGQQSIMILPPVVVLATFYCRLCSNTGIYISRRLQHLNRRPNFCNSHSQWQGFLCPYPPNHPLSLSIRLQKCS